MDISTYTDANIHHDALSSLDTHSHRLMTMSADYFNDNIRMG